MEKPKKRIVVVTLDTLAELFKDYLGEEYIHPDAKATRLMVNPQEQGKLALEVASPHIKPNAKNVFAHFDIKRIYTV
jgi:hypothetical protein